MQEKALYTTLTFNSLNSFQKNKQEMKYIQNKVDEIYKALEYKMYECALTLTMVLPDICARIAYKDSPRFKTKEGNWRVGEAYREWFKDYVFSYFNHDFLMPQKNLEYGFIGKYYEFTPKYCYHLRCYLLHEGNIEDMTYKEKSDGIIYVFGLTESSTCKLETLYPNGKIAAKGIEINISELCNKIIAGVEKFYAEVDSSEFQKYEFKIHRFNNNYDLFSRIKATGLDFENNKK